MHQKEGEFFIPLQKIINEKIACLKYKKKFCILDPTKNLIKYKLSGI